MFQNFDFQALENPDFKEDSVRELLILPIIERLGYSSEQVLRSKTLHHPFLKIGSKTRPITLIPDYLFRIAQNYAWVLDAKSPSENILEGGNVEQVYSYSIHPEVRTKFFALCNGRAFALFRQDEPKPFLYFQLQDIENYWETLERYLSPDAFQLGKTEKSYFPTPRRRSDFDYLNRPLLKEIEVKKQAAKRHFGVHGYFTKQAWNVVQTYIRNFSQEGDIVLDPFGGAGVTAIEALMIGRKAIHIDINPMSVFMVESLLAPVKNGQLYEAFEKIKIKYEKNLKKYTSLQDFTQQNLTKYVYPKNIALPKGSDVDSVEKLFSEEQLAQLAYLKYLSLKEKNKDIRKVLLLAFSGLITKVNLTTHYPKDKKGGADAAAFKYYRYRIAPDPAKFSVLDTFEERIKRIYNAQKEIEFELLKSNKTPEDIAQESQILKGSATDLKSFDYLKNLGEMFEREKGIPDQSIDYIYTDPPYGNKIPYLDLSTMWNAWLDLEVTDKDFELEAIEGGERNKSKDEYSQLIQKSIEEMYRVLKFDRWMSFVFSHKEPKFWHLIVETAEKCGFEYAGAVAQSNGHRSFKKIQYGHTVLSGQLIINFKKVKRPKTILQANLGMEISDVILQTVEGIIAKNNGATIEEINNEITIKGLEMGFIHLINKVYKDLTEYLLERFDYNASTKIFTIKENMKFSTHLDLNLRVRYYLISYLRRMAIENKEARFDEIVFNILPLLKNGVTPEEQTILNILENIAERIGEDSWKLKKEGQRDIF